MTLNFSIVGASAFKNAALTFLAAASLGFSTEARGQANESKRVRVLIAIDARANIQGIESNKSEVERLCNLLRQNRIDCAVDYMDAENLNPADIVNYYRNLEVAPDDTLVFYYTGHGATDAVRGPFLRTSGGDLLRSDLRRIMAEKAARLSIVLTDCCSLSGTSEMSFAPRARPPSEKFFKDLFLRHQGFVDITAATYRRGGNAEAAVFIPKSGGAFSMALFSTLCIAREVDYDTDRDGFFSWRELFPIIVERTNSEFHNFKRMVRNGTIRLSPLEWSVIADQAGQTPQAFSLGDGIASDPEGRPVEPPRKFRFGASIGDNNGLGVKIVQVVENSPATRVTVIDESNGARTETVARMIPGDTILFANGVRIESADQFRRILAELPPGGLLEFQGQDGSTGNSYRAQVRLDD